MEKDVVVFPVPLQKPVEVNMKL